MTNTTTTTTTPRTEIVFIDSRVQDFQTLLSAVPAGAEVHVLDASRDGVAQMLDALAGRSGIDAIHVIGHGSSASADFGSTTLNSADLSLYQTQLAELGSHLTATGDLLLYGCNVAQGDAGQAFIQQLAAITGADVAASTDLTGAAGLGGNWVLETHQGTIETHALPSNSDWNGLLGGGGGNQPPAFDNVVTPGFGYLAAGASPSGTTTVRDVVYAESSGTKYVAYMDTQNPAQVSVVKLNANGDDWTSVGATNFGTAVNTVPLALTTTSDGTPYVMYLDNATTKNIVMKFDGDSWVQVGSALSAAGQTYGGSLVTGSRRVSR